MSIESTILDVLKADSTLTALVSTFESSPSIFTDSAPEAAATPYIVCNFMQLNAPLEIGHFNLFINFFDYDKSAAAARSALLRIQVLLDDMSFEDDDNEWNAIRVFHEGGGHVPTPDARDIHYNAQYSIRAGRLAWSSTK